MYRRNQITKLNRQLLAVEQLKQSALVELYESGQWEKLVVVDITRREAQALRKGLTDRIQELEKAVYSTAEQSAEPLQVYVEQVKTWADDVRQFLDSEGP